MIRKLFITTILYAALMLLGLRATQKKAIQPHALSPTSGHISFILFTLIGNTLRMEQYDLQEVKSFQHIIHKDVRDKNLIFSIDLAEKGATPRTIQWDEETPGQLHVLAGRKNKSKLYAIDLEGIFDDTDEDVVAICFDCNIKHKRVEGSWNADIDIILPIKINSSDMKLVFDSKVKGACGFLMEHNSFCDFIKITGELTKKEALQNNVITEIKPESNFKIILEKIKNGTIYLKNITMSSLLTIRRIVETSLSTCIGMVYKK